MLLCVWPALSISKHLPCAGESWTVLLPYVLRRKPFTDVLVGFTFNKPEKSEPVSSKIAQDLRLDLSRVHLVVSWSGPAKPKHAKFGKLVKLFLSCIEIKCNPSKTHPDAHLQSISTPLIPLGLCGFCVAFPTSIASFTFSKISIKEESL